VHRSPRQQCHEKELPTALVKNKIGFAAYEVGVSALCTLALYEMTRHHRRGQRIDCGLVGHSVMDNCRMDMTPV
jgi:hypothetical protein